MCSCNCIFHFLAYHIIGVGRLMFRDGLFKSVKVGYLKRAFGAGLKLSQLVGNVAFIIYVCF